MAFESLTDRFSNIFKKLRGQTTLSEKNMDDMLKEIRIALLEADVNFKVVKSFIEDVKEKAVGQDVYNKVNPSQMIVKIVHDEIEQLLGADQSEIKYSKPLTTIMLVGLQGTGKTTTAGKLANYYKNKENKKVMLAALDVYRPAAIDQLETLANKVGVEFYSEGSKANPVNIAKHAKEKALKDNIDILVLDTAGRLQIDEGLMDELKNINHEVHPNEVLLLVDGAAGQDSVNVANAFNKDLHLTGIIMSKLDGDARGGAALSIKYLTGLPIKLIGIGENIGDLEVFYPDRMADRILGMGDVVSLVEKAKEVMDEKESEKEARKMMDGNFTLEDMLKQMKMVKKLGSLGGVARLIPGMPKLSEADVEKAEKEMKVFEAIVNSMTKYERRHPEILRFSHKNRIAKGSGLTNADVNRVLRKYEQSKEMMKQMKKYQNNPKYNNMFNK
ncbi:MAG: signal recognition particle protein [Bacilli bacterium]|nr:signal recognition particle protein [Bacilli bacterium]MDY6430286.1 signal recognition particle protein [Bacilli bacterium]